MAITKKNKNRKLKIKNKFFVLNARNKNHEAPIKFMYAPTRKVVSTPWEIRIQIKPHMEIKPIIIDVTILYPEKGFNFFPSDIFFILACGIKDFDIDE